MEEGQQPVTPQAGIRREAELTELVDRLEDRIVDLEAIADDDAAEATVAPDVSAPVRGAPEPPD